MRSALAAATGIVAVVVGVPMTSAAAGAPPARAAASTPRPATYADARLTGTFELDGRVTIARYINGEYAGQKAIRSWSFAPACASGACRHIKLARRRSRAIDHVMLTRRKPGYYTGDGRFYVPLNCDGKIVKKGESVPFTITVRITGARTVDGAEIATSLEATYTNRSRKNLTRCVAAPGHDAAVYTGQLVSASPPPPH